MNSDIAAGKEILTLQIKSLLIFDFLNEYNQFEKIVRTVFEKNIPKLPKEKKQQLYFFYGGKIGSCIEYEDPGLKFQELKYDSNENFSQLTINQILKIFKPNPGVIPEFNFQISSIQRSMTEFPFFDSAIKLLNMRNKLAHELIHLEFKNRDIIEQLSMEKIISETFEILNDYDISKMDNDSKQIASNIIYMRAIIDKLKDTVVTDE